MFLAEHLVRWPEESVIYWPYRKTEEGYSPGVPLSCPITSVLYSETHGRLEESVDDSWGLGGANYDMGMT